MKKYSKEMFDFVQANIKGCRIYRMAEMVNEKFGLNITEAKMKAYCSNHRLTNGLFQKSVDLRDRSMFTQEQKDFIKNNYIGIGNKELTELFNKTFGTNFTSGQIKRYKHSKHYNSGITGHFEKGHVSANKGQKMTAEQYEKCKATMFKKGDIPHNHKSVGSERINKDGYLLIKIAEPNKYVLKHRYIWEQANGPIPKGHVLIFLDGNKQNFDLNNLACITLAENAVLNHLKLRSTDKDITQAAINVAKIKHKISKLSKKNKEK